MHLFQSGKSQNSTDNGVRPRVIVESGTDPNAQQATEFINTSVCINVVIMADLDTLNIYVKRI